MVAGHLSEKNGNYYAVLSYTDVLGKRRTKWVNTGLPVRGNKKKAEAFLMDFQAQAYRGCNTRCLFSFQRSVKGFVENVPSPFIFFRAFLQGETVPGGAKSQMNQTA